MRSGSSEGAPPAAPSAPVWPVGLFVVVYLAVTVVARPISGNTIDVRLLSPIYVPVAVVAAVALERVRAVSRRPAERSLLKVGAAAWLLVLAAWFVRLAVNDGRTERVPTGIARTSELVGAVRRLPASARVFSDEPWGLYYVTERQPLPLAPGHMVHGLSQRPETIGVLARSARCRPTFLAWFGPADESPGWADLPEALRGSVDVSLAQQLDDGELTRSARPARAGECDCPSQSPTGSGIASLPVSHGRPAAARSVHFASAASSL